MAGPYYVDITTGNDLDDGLSEGNAFATLEKAADTIASNEICHVKGSANYVVQDGANDCVMQITTPGASAAEMIIWRGYTNTPGDGGTVTIDADANTLASAVKTAIGGFVFNKFENFRFTGGSGNGFDGNGVTDDGIYFENCQFDNNDGWGFQGDNGIYFIKCTLNINGSGNSDPDSAWYIGVKSYTSTGTGLRGELFIWCLSYDMGANNHLIANTAGLLLALNNTIDGENAANSIGIFNDSASGSVYALNNALHDLAEGIKSDNTRTDVHISDYNLFNSNGADRTNIPVGPNDVAAVPGFENEGARNYAPGTGSALIGAAFDVGEI